STLAARVSAANAAVAAPRTEADTAVAATRVRVSIRPQRVIGPPRPSCLLARTEHMTMAATFSSTPPCVTWEKPYKTRTYRPPHDLYSCGGRLHRVRRVALVAKL